MNLSEMRSVLLDNIDDPQSTFLSVSSANRYLNIAMRHVANWADARQQGLFYFTTGAVNFPAGTVAIPYVEVGFDDMGIDGSSLRPFRRLIQVAKLASPARITLKIVPIEDREKYLKDAGELIPRAYVGENGIALINPSTAATYTVLYVYSLPDMSANGDTPGTTGGVGTANALPIEYHPLIPLYATVLALQADNVDASQWREVYAEQKQAVDSTLVNRRAEGT